MFLQYQDKDIFHRYSGNGDSTMRAGVVQSHDRGSFLYSGEGDLTISSRIFIHHDILHSIISGKADLTMFCLGCVILGQR